MNKPFNLILKQARHARRWTQRELARRSGVPRSLISLYEINQRHPNPKYAARLETTLGLRNGCLLPPTTKRPRGWPRWKKTRFWNRFCPHPKRHILERQRDNWYRLRAARKTDPVLYDWCMAQIRAQGHRPALAEFLRYMACDTGLEILSKLHLVALTAMLTYVPISRLGWDRLPIVVESTGDVVGHKHWPALVIEKPMLIALFPQVPLKTAGKLTPTGENPKFDVVRVDFLACIRLPDGCHWVHVEVDGGWHASKLDDERAKEIGLPRVKLTEADIRAHDFLDRLVAKIQQALG